MILHRSKVEWSMYNVHRARVVRFEDLDARCLHHGNRG